MLEPWMLPIGLVAVVAIITVLTRHLSEGAGIMVDAALALAAIVTMGLLVSPVPVGHHDPGLSLMMSALFWYALSFVTHTFRLTLQPASGWNRSWPCPWPPSRLSWTRW